MRSVQMPAAALYGAVLSLVPLFPVLLFRQIPDLRKL
jgi:hypothetical protein